MPGVVIASVVEGQGEVQALPVLLQRIANEVLPVGRWIEWRPPRRVARTALTRQGGIEELARQMGSADGLLFLLDADDDCPAELGRELLDRARRTRSDRRISVVLPKREFEAWFLAAASSLRGVRGLPEDFESPDDPEGPRGCKEILSNARVDGQRYKPAADQAALTAGFDLALARANSPSFDKLYRDVAYLLDIDLDVDRA